MAKHPKTVRGALGEQYTLIRQLGQGGCGVVYLAKSDDGATLAVKILRTELVTRERLKRFKNELTFCSRHQDPHILQVLDWGECDTSAGKSPFYVMPHYAETLRSLMKDGLSPGDADRVVIQLLDCVEAVHLLGVVHRDIKPENLFYDTENKQLVLGDFGAAHFTEEQLATDIETAPGTRLANFLYSAPEQRRPGARVDSRADLYALGVIINELFTGDVLQGAGYRVISEVSQHHAYYDQVVEALVQHSPSKRPATVDVVKNQVSVLGKLAVSRKKLNELTNTVVSYDTPDDPLVQQPPTLVGVDVQGRTLTFQLSRSVNRGWITAFQETNYQTSLMGASPADFTFRGDRATLTLRYNEPSVDNVQRIVDDFKRFLGLGTTLYSELLTRSLREKAEAERKELERRVAEEKARQQILGNIKL